MDFKAFINDITAEKLNVFGVEIYKNGRLLHEYGDTIQRHPIYSATKTITSIAAGMAADEGRLDIGRSVLYYLPTRFVSVMPHGLREKYKSISVRRLMTMSVSGYPFRPSGESWLADALSYDIGDPDDLRFSYSNISAYLTGVAVSNAVDEDLYSYLSRKLFSPLDIKDPPFARCPDGYFYGASSMELSVNELSRIGLLLYNKGVYNGKRLLSESYVNEATSLQQMNREGGYGYFIWKYRGGFSINGKWKQKCYVLPDEGLVITFLSHIEEKCGLTASMERHILGI